MMRKIVSACPGWTTSTLGALPRAEVAAPPQGFPGTFGPPSRVQVVPASFLKSSDLAFPERVKIEPKRLGGRRSAGADGEAEAGLRHFRRPGGNTSVKLAPPFLLSGH